jgi:hypothetical protein
VRLQAVRQNLFIRDVKRRQDFEQLAEQIFYEDQIIFYFLDLDFAHKFSLNEILPGSTSFRQRKFFRQRHKLFQAQFLCAYSPCRIQPEQAMAEIHDELAGRRQVLVQQDFHAGCNSF